MDKLNRDLIKTKKKLTKVEAKIKRLTKESKFLQDKLHLYFDSCQYDTTDTEKFIIADFWSRAYKNYRDGGYITNDNFISDVRFSYEVQLINKIIDQENIKTDKVIDICCGNGRYTKEFAKYFQNAVGMDLSLQRIQQNKKENQENSIDYINADFMKAEPSELGTFDLVFASDIFTYTDKSNITSVFNKLLKLVKKGGVLLIRESTRLIGYEDYKSRNYVAYYRNVNFYKKHCFKDYFEKSFRNFGYNLYHLDKYFNVHKEAREQLRKNPALVKNMVKEAVDKHQRTCHFYVYRQ